MTKVLVIDDEVSITDLLHTVLARKGYEVLIADRGSKALELYHREKPHIAILDLRMPDMNGMAVLETIRKVDSTLPVIILTGAGHESDEKRARELGVIDFLEKTFSLHQLGQALSTALKQRGLAEPLPIPARWRKHNRN
jgi:DNA-binding response OmpR family regulator